LTGLASLAGNGSGFSVKVNDFLNWPELFTLRTFDFEEIEGDGG
jgi:hypothetical protein